jgi:hypothetical protein
MWNRKNRIRRNIRRNQVNRRIIPLVDSFEPRLLMSADGFLQGTVFVDNNLNNQYEPANGDAPLAGALIQLFNQSNTLVASTTSATNGSYLLTGLTPGTYNLVETPPSSYANEGTQVNSPLDPVSATTSNSVTVQVEDLSDLSVTYNAPFEFSTLEPGTVALSASPNGGVSYDSEAYSIGQMPITVTYPGGTTAQFSSDCVDVFSELTYGDDNFSASGEPLSTTLVPATNAGAIGYLYDQYGYMLSAQPATLSEAYNLQALQLAIWKLIYDTGTNLTTFSSGNIEDPSIETAYDGYESVENDSLSDLESRALGYISQGLNYSEQAIELYATSGSNGYQNLLAPGSLNFSNVPKASPSITTTPGGTVVIGSGAGLSDTAILSGGTNPTGTVTFTLYGPGETVVTTESDNVSGDGSYSTPTAYVPTGTGTYEWAVAYSGDSNNNGASSPASAEQETVSLATPAISTTPNTSTGTCGSTETIKDKASLTGGDDPTGTITFTLYNPNGTLVDTETVNVSGDGSYSTPSGYILSTTNAVAGTYQWDSTYSGNGNNNAVSENNATAEQVVIGKATPGLSTTPSTSTGTCGSTETIKDKASLTGGDDPTGTITFTLYNPNGTLVDTETVNVSGDGSYSTPSGYTLSTTNAVAGTYQWDSTYGGNGNNNAVSENNATAEQVVVGKAGPSISTTPNTTVVSAGTATSLTDTATLSGGDNPTGTITFTLYSPSGSKLDTATVSVSGDGSYTTPSYSLSSSASAGIYQWDATYNGDGNNSSASDNNDSSEQVWVITPCCNLQNVSFTVDNSSGQKVGTYSSLGGNVQQGDTVTANFTVPNGDYDQLTIVSYIAPQSYYSQTSAYLQQVYQSSTGVFAPGSHSLTVTVPGSYFQVDFVCGTPITQLGLNPGDFYNAQSRMQSSDNGGTTIPSVLAGSNVGTGETATPAFWTSSSGQALINNLNGGSSATNLGNWLGTISPNLLGKLAGETNAQVASYVKGLGTSSAVSQVVASALAAYVTDSSLAGTAAASYGFTVTAYGTGIDHSNVGSNGSALGLSNNTVYSLVTLLAAIDSESSNGSINSSANGAASTIFTAINKAGGIS